MGFGCVVPGVRRRLWAAALGLGVLCLTTGWARAKEKVDEKPILAVMHIEDGTGVLKQSDLINATDYLRAVLISSRSYLLVDKGRLEEKRREVLSTLRRESHEGCYDQKCRVALGRQLAADTMLSCRITALGKTCTFACELIPLDRAVAERGGHLKFDCTPEGLAQAVDGVVALMTEAESDLLAEPVDVAAPAVGQEGRDAPASGRPEVSPPSDREGEGESVKVAPGDPEKLSFGEFSPSMDPEGPRKSRFVRAGFSLRNYHDFKQYNLSVEAWKTYKRGKVSGWHMVWCWMIPGSCLYMVARGGRGNAFHVVRGVAYSLMTLGGYALALYGSDGVGTSRYTTGIVMTGLGAYGNIIDGSFSLVWHNRDLFGHAQREHPRRAPPVVEDSKKW